MENDRVLKKITFVLMLVYAAFLNYALMISFIIGGVVSLCLVLMTEINDEDIMRCINTTDIPDHVIKKYGEILLFGLAVFMLVTILSYKIITNV